MVGWSGGVGWHRVGEVVGLGWMGYVIGWVGVG